jgi:Protein of unknown function (DUF3102)
MEELDQPTTAEEINRLHRDLQALAMQSLDHAIRIGELLSKVKTQLPHGRWIPWLNSNVKFSERTARNYIGVFENRMALKSARVADLTDAYKILSNRSRLAGSKAKSIAVTQGEELLWAGQEEDAQNSQLPRMTREEAEQLDAQIVALLREACDQAPERFAEILAYCNSEFRNPAHVEKFLHYADELEILFGPFDVPEEACQCLREYQR